MPEIQASTGSLQQRCYIALMSNDPKEKCALTAELADWFDSTYLANPIELDQSTSAIKHQTAQIINTPGRPRKPDLVLPKLLKKRGLGTQPGRNHLMHAVAHIEFNAINLALDAVYRFANQPIQFYADWLRVAKEEAKHFSLVCEYLYTHNIQYGDYPAHDGLWDMCLRTNDNVLARMALVPRVLEARGLDVTPGLIAKLEQAKDFQAAEVLQIIYNEEIDHVRIGSDWFIFHCKQQNQEPKTTFLDCVEKYLHGELRGPFNLTARQKAGFSKAELDYLSKNYG